MMCYKVLNLNIKERENSDFEVRKKGLPTLISSTRLPKAVRKSDGFFYVWASHPATSGWIDKA